MSDFGEICPLFSTGVFHEVTFPGIGMTDITYSGNALIGTMLSISHVGAFTFGRTVMVTGAYIRRKQSQFCTLTVQLNFHTSQRAVCSVIGTISIPTSGSKIEVFTWQEIAVTAHTFTSTDVLGLAAVVASAQSAGVYDLIVRYKEK